MQSCLSLVLVYKKMTQHYYMWEKVAYLIYIIMSVPNKEMRYVVSPASKKNCFKLVPKAFYSVNSY